MLDLTNKVALITGARRGMGKAHAKKLAQAGAKVVVTDVNLDDCQKVAGEIEAEGGECLDFAMDVTDKKQIDEVITEVVEKWGSLDILINNAGIFDTTPAEDMTEDQWSKTLEINLKGQFLCAQRAAEEMKKNEWGRVVNITSIASGEVGVGFKNAAHYTASKGGIKGMTETLAVEWADYGINVNAIAPGAIETPMTEDVDTESLTQTIPLSRVGEPEEVANAVVFLSSEEASYITGATLYVDGGWMSQ